MARRQPSTTKDQVNQLWDEVIGTNGAGLLGKVDEIRNRQNDVIFRLGNIEQKIDNRNGQSRSKMLIIKDVVWVLVSLFGGGFFIALIRGLPTLIKAVNLIQQGGP